MVKKILAAAALALAVAAVSGSMQAIDWGKRFSDFGDTCRAMGGVLHGTAYSATCSYGGGVMNVPAASPGWTVDVAEGSVATWRGGGKVTEQSSAGTVVVACYGPEGEAMRLWHQQCVPQ